MNKNALLFALFLLGPSLFGQVPTQINVEIDWMDVPGPGGHSHRPSTAEIAAVVQMFACRGITLNVVVDDTVQHVNVLRMDPDSCLRRRFFGYTGQNSYGAIKAANFSRGPGWHYCIFAHQYEDSCGRTTTSSGLANFVGDIVVTLGAFSGQVGTSWDRAATFAHELGHNLGLNHNGNMGNENASGSFAPSVPSIMTYFYQLRGVRNNLECQGLVTPGLHSFKHLDYSGGLTCALNENALDETRGNGIKKVDWNCDGVLGGTFARDLSNARTDDGWCGATGTRTILTDYNEWANIRDRTFAIGEPRTLAEESRVVYPCITYEEHVRDITARPPCLQPPVANEPCINTRMVFVAPGNGGGSGSCATPYLGLATAQAQSGNGAVLYLLPGNYGEAGLILNRPITITGAGGAVVGTTSASSISSASGLSGADLVSRVSSAHGTTPKTSAGGMQPAGRMLYQNYPNPFNPVTTISYDILEPAHVTLKVFDYLGREVATLVDEVQAAGSKNIEWNATAQSSGVYFCRLVVGPHIQTRRLMLMK